MLKPILSIFQNSYGNINTPGNTAIAMSEYPSGAVVDVHNNKFVDGFSFNSSLWAGWHVQQVPAHEQNDENGTVWTVFGLRKTEGDVIHQKRIVISLNPTTGEQKVEGEYDYPDIDSTKCLEPGQRYPDTAARMKYIHSFQKTDDYIIVPETSYLFDPCTVIQHGPPAPDYLKEFTFESEVESTVVVINLKTQEVKQTNVPAMFCTHGLGAYQDDEQGLLHFDVLSYENANSYDKWTYVENIITEDDYPKDLTRAIRYTLKMDTMQLDSITNLIDSDDIYALEFSTINTAYQGKPYKYAYMIHNPFKRFGSVCKLNVDTKEFIRREMPDGLFPTEPIFIPAPDATTEDDGVLVMGGIDARKKVGFLMVYDASNMELLYHASAPRLTLQGIHAKFYPFEAGCSVEDCTPNFELLDSAASNITTHHIFSLLVAAFLVMKL